MSALSNLLSAANHREPMATRKRAERIGRRLHHATIAAYQRGDHPAHPDEVTLQSLAEAYRLALQAVQQAAGVPSGAGSYVPPPEAARHTARQQAAITELIMSMVERGGGSSEVRSTEAQKNDNPPESGPNAGGVTQLRPVRPSHLPTAARRGQRANHDFDQAMNEAGEENQDE